MISSTSTNILSFNVDGVAVVKTAVGVAVAISSLETSILVIPVDKFLFVKEMKYIS